LTSAGPYSYGMQIDTARWRWNYPVSNSKNTAVMMHASRNPQHESGIFNFPPEEPLDNTIVVCASGTSISKDACLFHLCFVPSLSSCHEKATVAICVERIRTRLGVVQIWQLTRSTSTTENFRVLYGAPWHCNNVFLPFCIILQACFYNAK